MKEFFNRLCQTAHAAFVAPNRDHVRYMLLVVGIAFISLGLTSSAFANDSSPNYERLDNVIGIVLNLIEGRFGVLVMLCAGIGAIISSAFGQYRAALSLLVVALGAFILRTIITIFFNTTGIDSLDQ